MKRYLLNGCIIIWYILTLVVNWICMGLDNLFYPCFKKTEIKPPVFIIGMPRSATTLIQNIIISDTSNFTCPKLWEILFTPSILQKKLINQIIRLDKRVNGFIYKRVKRIDKYLFRKMENHHPISLFSVDEDNYLFLHTLTAASLTVLFPKWKNISILRRFDDEIPECRKKFEMNFYKGCIQRHLYVFGKGRRYISKNPPNSLRIRSLQATFPGCQFIYMIRDPLYTVASATCIFTQFRKMFLLHSDRQKISYAILLMADLFYNYPLIECNDLKGKTLCIVTFNEITGDAHDTIRKLYGNLNIEFTSEYEEFLLNSKSTIEIHKTKNKYNPEELGFTLVLYNELYDFMKKLNI